MKGETKSDDKMADDNNSHNYNNFFSAAVMLSGVRIHQYMHHSTLLQRKIQEMYDKFMTCYKIMYYQTKCKDSAA